MKMAKSYPFCILLYTPTPRRRSLRLGAPEAQISALSGPPKRSSAPPRRSSALLKRTPPPRHTYESYFGSSLPLILTIIHWINEDPNK